MKFIAIAIFIALMCWHPVGMLILLVAAGAWANRDKTSLIQQD